MSEKLSAIHNEITSSETTHSIRKNKDSSSLKQLNYNAQQREIKRKLRNKISSSERKNADSDLEKELLFLGASISKERLDDAKNSNSEIISELSIEEKIKSYTESIKDGKSPQEILQLLITKFEKENGVEKLISNFKNFLKLHQYAETKPPKEKRAILNIIKKADFSNENAFTTSLTEIANSSDISSITKLELSKQFGADVFTVDVMDFQLKEIKAHTKAIEQEIEVKSSKKKSLDSEIENLEDEINKLPLDDPKRLELKNELHQRKKSLEETEVELVRLEQGKPQDVSFQMREGFNAVQNPDGSRSVKIMNNDFAIRLPSNMLPFTDTKNLRAINMVFPFAILKEQNLAGFLFRPNLGNNDIANKVQRDLGHSILSSLGYDDTKILSEENIKQLKEDLMFFKPQNGKTNQQNLITLGVFDVASQSLNFKRLIEVMISIRQKRGMNNQMLFRELTF